MKLAGLVFVVVATASVARAQQEASATIACRPGHFLSASGLSLSCKPCKRGYYSSGGRRARCLKCANGFTTSGTGASKCNVGLCPPGTGGPNCEPCAGSWSPGRPRGQDCSPCPVFKLKECYYSTGCDPVKGVQVLKQPAGTPCGVNGGGKCDGQGTCNDPASANCAAGTGGPDCSRCPERTYSLGQPRGEECMPCPMVKLMECFYSNGCDPAKGIEILKRKAGYPCGSGKGSCDGNGSCVCSAGSGGWDCQACPIFTWSPGLPQEQACKKCDPPRVMCKRMQRPCDIEPPCDTSTGEQTSMCYVTAPDDWPCQLLDGTDKAGKCKAGECLA